MTALDIGALAASAIAAGAGLAALLARGAASTMTGVGVAIAALALVVALYDAPAAAAFAIVAAAALAVMFVGAELLAPEPPKRARPPFAAMAAVAAVAGGLCFAMGDAPGPVALGGVNPGVFAGAVAAVVMSAGAAAAFALLDAGGRNAASAPAQPAIAFPGREHAVSRGIGKGLTPLVALAAFALAAPTASPVAAGALLALALSLYALVFGLDAALRIASARALGGLTWIGLALTLAIAAAPRAWNGPAFAFDAAPAPAVRVILEAALAGAIALMAFGALSQAFYAFAGRLPSLPGGDHPVPEDRSRG
ncbi:MAG: hypothetical protein ACOYM8_05180 [Caulobacterales bacterium]